MTILLVLSLLPLVWWCVVVPVRNGQRLRERRAFAFEYRHARLSAIQRYYPVCHRLSMKEIELIFDVETSYRNIGRDLLASERLGE